ncbi:BTB/POZ domain [Trinorchestia longiramus]|nr:BTB/POZ domain [Trinorchestia longiramus]
MDDSKPKDYCVKWNQHKQALVRKTSKLLASEKFSDVTLSCTEGKNTEIPAHKIVLSSCSEYFSKLFETNKLSHPVLVITNVNESTVMQILEYMYVGQVVVPQNDVPGFMRAAKAFQVSGLDIDEGRTLPACNNDDVQFKELDLSRNKKVENLPNSTPSDTVTEESIAIPQSFIVPSQPALSSALLNHGHLIPIDNPFLSTAALALRNNTQFLSSRLGSPSRVAHSGPSLPKRSPSGHMESPKQTLPENYCRDSLNTANNRRFSNSPEDSVHSNASLDLTKAASSNSPLNRLVSNPLSSLVSVADQHSHASMNPVSAAIASQFNHYSTFPSQIHVSQSLIHKRSRSKSPESAESKPSQDCVDDDHTSPRFQDNQGNSPHDSEQSGKQNSSGGASEQYSDDDSGPEAKYNESAASRTTGNGRAGSVSPGPSTSTPKVSETFGQALFAGYPRMPWTYGVDDSKIVADNTGPQGFWKSSFKNSLLAPYLSSSLPPLSPGSHSATLSPTFPGLYPPTSLASSWRCTSGSPPPMHSMPFLRSNECARCGRLYKTRKGLKHHIKNECGVEPRFQCTRCDWKFKQKAHLLRHMARKHTPLPDQRCGAS